MFLLELRPTASKALTCIRPILDTAMKEDRLRRQNEQIDWLLREAYCKKHQNK